MTDLCYPQPHVREGACEAAGHISSARLAVAEAALAEARSEVGRLRVAERLANAVIAKEDLITNAPTPGDVGLGEVQAYDLRSREVRRDFIQAFTEWRALALAAPEQEAVRATEGHHDDS